MSKDPEEPDDGTLDEIVRALRKRGELIPTTEVEVSAAEHAGEPELELPESLREYRAKEPAEPHAPVLDFDHAKSRTPNRTFKRRVLTHALSAALGALAAGLALTWQHRPLPPAVTSAGSELVPSAKPVKPVEPASKKKPIIELTSACDNGCCAGSACESASENLKACPSGQRCIACNGAEQSQGPYRLRFGAMILSDAGSTLLAPNANPPLDLCISTAGNELACVPALSDDTSDDSWRALDHAISTQDLLGGLGVEVRRHGSTEVLASWKHPVSTTPEVFCKGLLIQPTQAKKIVGRLSVFVEQTHFVELERTADVRSLLDLESRVEFRGVTPSIHETTQAGAAHFALTLGPLTKSQAESIRWALLDNGLGAKIAYGLDYVSVARKSP